jgi:hypothetical protein
MEPVGGHGPRLIRLATSSWTGLCLCSQRQVRARVRVWVVNVTGPGNLIDFLYFLKNI